MNVIVEQLPNCLATLKIEVEPERVKTAREAVLKEYQQYAKIPGFRAGKVPRATIEKRFKKQIGEELERKVLNETTREAIQKEKLRVLTVSNVDDVTHGEDSAMSFTATVVTHPAFELPPYKGLVVQMKPTDVTDADVEASIEEAREQSADFVELDEDRGAAMEDFVVVDYHGTIEGADVHEKFPKAGKPLTANEDFWIKMTDEAFFPGFCGALVGAKAEETREFDVTVPADFPVEGMPGQVIHYKVTLKSIKRKVLPELNDEFAATIAKDKTLAELRDMARQELQRQKRNESEAHKRSDIMRQVLSAVECELPMNLVRQQTQSILNEIVQENQERGVTEEVLKENEKEIVGTATANAKEKINGTFVLMRIAEAEGIRVTREELLGRVAGLAQRYQMSFEKMLKELEKRGAIEQIHEEMLTGKTLEFLVSNASVSTAPAVTK